MSKVKASAIRAFEFFIGRQSRDKFIKYLIVGGTSFLLEYGLFFILFRVIGLNELVSNTSAITIAFIFNFLLNRIWSFKSKEKFTKQFLMLICLFAFNMIVSNLFIWVATEYLNISPLISKVLIMGLIVLWNFVIYKKIVYRK